jgi:hypothetical protein
VEALAKLKVAIENDRNFAAAHAQYGATHWFFGKAVEVIPNVETALRLSPRDPLRNSRRPRTGGSCQREVRVRLPPASLVPLCAHTCLGTLEALIRSGVPDAVYFAERAVDSLAGSETDVSRSVDALHLLRDGLEDMAVSGARLNIANTILTHIEKKLRELQRHD